jgi:hypothetical protein
MNALNFYLYATGGVMPNFLNVCVHLALWHFVGYPIVDFLYSHTQKCEIFFTTAPPSIPQSHTKKPLLK